jgi:iron(III) transport system substrate-binding protein
VRKGLTLPLNAKTSDCPRRRSLLRCAAFAAALAAGGLVTSACGSSSSSTTLILYNGQHPQTTDALITAFEQKTGINVLVRNDDEDILADQIVQEGSRSPADLIFTENSPALEFLQNKGLLAAVDPSTLAHTASRFNSPQGDWVGVTARVSVLIYNTDELTASQLPTSVLQLADPRWSGKLAIAVGETDFQPIVTAVERAYGKQRTLQWLEGLKANAGGHTYPDNETITSMVNDGTCAIGIINQYYWYRERVLVGASAMHSAIAYLAPRDPGYVVDISGAAVLASSKHRAAAEAFLAFITSNQGQEIIAHGTSFEYPVAAGVAAPAGETPFAQLQPYPINLAELGDGASAIALLQQVQLL